MSWRWHKVSCIIWFNLILSTIIIATYSKWLYNKISFQQKIFWMDTWYNYSTSWRFLLMKWVTKSKTPTIWPQPYHHITFKHPCFPTLFLTVLPWNLSKHQCPFNHAPSTKQRQSILVYRERRLSRRKFIIKTWYYWNISLII